MINLWSKNPLSFTPIFVFGKFDDIHYLIRSIVDTFGHLDI
jgi:hypothetical protein